MYVSMYVVIAIFFNIVAEKPFSGMLYWKCMYVCIIKKRVLLLL